MLHLLSHCNNKILKKPNKFKPFWCPYYALLGFTKGTLCSMDHRKDSDTVSLVSSVNLAS